MLLLLHSGRGDRVLVVALLPDVERLEQRRHQLQVEDGLGFALLATLDTVQALELRQVRRQDGLEPRKALVLAWTT